MDSWRYEPTPDFDRDPITRLKDFPRHPDLWVYAMRLAANVFMRAVLRIYHRFEIVGRENLPASGSFVVVANHSSHVDTVAILAAMPLAMIHRVYPAAASDYFFTSLPRLAFSAVVVNAMPFDRKVNPRESLDLCRRVLESEGNVLVLFPEGTRTPDGTLGTFKPGIGFVAAGTTFPVVPCYLEGAFDALPKGSFVPRPRKLRLRIGSPMTFADRGSSRDDALAIASSLRESVERLQRMGETEGRSIE